MIILDTFKSLNMRVRADELDTPDVRKIAPMRVKLDFVRGNWLGEFGI